MRKWYYELTGIIGIITIGVAVVLNINFGSKPEPIDKRQNFQTETFVVKKDSLYSKWAEGKSLFKANCAACHNPKADGTGPALQGATARWNTTGKFKRKTGEQWLKIWIHNWNDAVNAGHPYAINMSNSRPAMMNVFTTLKDKDIDAIIFYVENANAYQPPVPKGAVYSL